MGFDLFKNFAVVTLGGTIDAAVTTNLNLGTGGAAALPSAPFNATIWNDTDYPGTPNLDPNREILRFTSVTSDTVNAFSRAQEGTSAATHNTGGKTYKLLATVTAKSLNADTPRQLAGGVGLISQNPTSYTSFLPSGAITVPASYLVAGDRLVLKAMFQHHVAFVNTQSYQIVFGGQVLASKAASTAGMGGVQLTADMAVRSSTVQLVMATIIDSSGGNAATAAIPGLTLTSSNTLDIQAKLDAGPGSDVLTLEGYSILLYRTA